MFKEHQRKAQLAWAKEHLTWTPQQWQEVLCSGESIFNILAWRRV